MYFIVANDQGKFWNGYRFHSAFLPDAQILNDDQVDAVRRYCPSQTIVVNPIASWADYAELFIRAVRENGPVGVRHYLTLVGPGYRPFIYDLTRHVDYLGRVSVRSKYTLQDIRYTAKKFDELAQVIERALAARNAA